MAIDHIVEFDGVVGNVLKALHQSFPTPIYLDPCVIGLSTVAATFNEWGEPTNDEGWIRADALIRLAARWLADEGYLQDRSSLWPNHYSLSAAGLKCVHSLHGDECPLPRLLKD